MKKNKLLCMLLSLLLLTGILTGCGAASQTAASANGAVSYDAAMEEAAPEAMAAENSLTSSGSDTTMVLPENRKWIVTVNLSAETEDLDAMTQTLQDKITDLGGYVEDQTVYNGSAYANRRYRSASMTVRIPAEDVDKFTEEVAGISNVVSQQKNLEYITLQYVDTESRLTALETEQTRLLELLEQAETTADLLEIEARLSEVRYQLESATSQLRLYDNQVDYATIYLSIEEVQEYPPIEEPNLWERIRDGFVGSLKGLGNGAVDLLVWIIVSSPYLIVLGAGITLVVVLIRRSHKNKKSNPPAESKE